MRREERRYPALATISVVLKVVAVIVAIIGIISAIGALATGFPLLTRLASFLGILISTVVPAIAIYALADLILVVMDIEHNTFLTSEAVSGRPVVTEQRMPEARPEMRPPEEPRPPEERRIA